MAATATIRMRPRPTWGPATRRGRLPVLRHALSALVHGAGIAAVLAPRLPVAGGPTKTYFVNLEPSVPARGASPGRARRRPHPSGGSHAEGREGGGSPSCQRGRPRPSPPRPRRLSSGVASASSPACATGSPVSPAPKLPEMPTRELPRVAARTRPEGIARAVTTAPPAQTRSALAALARGGLAPTGRGARAPDRGQPGRGAVASAEETSRPVVPDGRPAEGLRTVTSAWGYPGPEGRHRVRDRATAEVSRARVEKPSGTPSMTWPRCGR
jgi:hypothetical protein